MNILIAILNMLFTANKTAPQEAPKSPAPAPKPTEPTKAEPVQASWTDRVYITVDDILTSSGNYPERKNSREVTPDLLQNAAMTAQKVNGLLNELRYDKAVTLSSGFRPASVNAAIANAAKRSAHMICKAVDILDDKDQTIAKMVYGDGKGALLRKWGLFQERRNHTVGQNTNWCHLDHVSRVDRLDRNFDV